MAIKEAQTSQTEPMQKNARLLAQVDERRREIRTDSYPVSIGELTSLYKEGEMVINPKFQRFFRWTDQQKTAFAESILLGIPLPPVFVSTDENGVWNVVDGLQRLSTIFQIMGKLPGMPALRFTQARYLTELAGCEWGDLPQTLQLDFRRAKINVSIILRGGDTRAQYDLFERLNTGGAHLSEQEVRNCLLVMENEAFFDWLVNLSETPAFKECVAINERFESEGYHKELASRFLILFDIPEENLRGIGDMGTFVNEKMLEMAGEDQAHLEIREKVFKDTFDILSTPEMSENAFKRYDAENERFRGIFLISPFEAVACGIAYHLSKGASVDDFPADKVLKKVQNIWEDSLFTDIRKTARKGAARIPKTIPYGRKIFDPKA